MMKLLQFSIIVAVLGSNGAYHWTPNPYAAGIVAVVAAFAVTVLINDSLRFIGWLLQPLKHLDRKQVPRDRI